MNCREHVGRQDALKLPAANGHDVEYTPGNAWLRVCPNAVD